MLPRELLNVTTKRVESGKRKEERGKREEESLLKRIWQILLLEEPAKCT